MSSSQQHFGNGQVFSCQQCGQCCFGAGGIVLSEHDSQRLASFLNLDLQRFLDRFAEFVAGKFRLQVGADNYCVFFQNGCSVHEAKPDVCRAWPFFRGNLQDPDSLEMAKEYCPGIHKDADFAAFAAEGKSFLRREGLVRHDTQADARALCLDDDAEDDIVDGTADAAL